MRTLKNPFLAGLLACLALAGCQKAAETPAQAGKTYFESVGCVKCHQIGGNGGTYGPDLTLVGFRKSSSWLDTWLKDPHSWRRQTVMPNFHFNDEARAAIVAYLSEQKGQAWAERPWNHADLMGDKVRRGEVLFNKAGCVACHSQEGRGGYPNNNVAGNQIPSLSKVFETYTKEELMKKIRGGVVPVPTDSSKPLPMIQMPKWGEQLKSDEISAVADYLISLGKKGAKKAAAAGGSDW